MTPLEADLHILWDEVTDAEQEHDRERASRCWARLRALQSGIPEQRMDCE